MNNKMAEIDIDPFGEHEWRPEGPTDEHITLDLVIPGRSTWEPTCEQETSFGGRSTPLHKARPCQRNRLLINQAEGLYERLSQKLLRTSEVFHYDLFELRYENCTSETKASP